MKPACCVGCPLYAAPGPVFGDGPEDAAIMLVGEGPGADELTRKKPFVGPAGRVLSLALKVAGLQRNRLYITNAIKCMGTPSQGALNHCRAAWLDDELRKVQPNVVVAIGSPAFDSLMRDYTVRKITTWRGFVTEAPDVPASIGTNLGAPSGVR